MPREREREREREDVSAVALIARPDSVAYFKKFAEKHEHTICKAFVLQEMEHHDNERARAHPAQGQGERERGEGSVQVQQRVHFWAGNNDVSDFLHFITFYDVQYKSDDKDNLQQEGSMAELPFSNMLSKDSSPVRTNLRSPEARYIRPLSGAYPCISSSRGMVGAAPHT